MALKPGDRVSLSISPVVALSRFVNCKAHATITRELGEDVEADLADMEAELVPLYRRGLLVELGQLSELQDIVGVPGETVDWGSVEGLVEYCVRILDGNHDQEETGQTRRAPTRRRSRGKKGSKREVTEKEGPRKKKKGPSKKARRRRG